MKTRLGPEGSSVEGLVDVHRAPGGDVPQLQISLPFVAIVALPCATVIAPAIHNRSNLVNVDRTCVRAEQGGRASSMAVRQGIVVFFIVVGRVAVTC
jgi:hypothetical protein